MLYAYFIHHVLLITIRRLGYFKPNAQNIAHRTVYSTFILVWKIFVLVVLPSLLLFQG